MKRAAGVALALALAGCGASESPAANGAGGASSTGSAGGSGGAAFTFVPPPPPSGTPVAAPLVGSGGLGFATGSAFPGAAAPNGMAKVGPDTRGPWGQVGFLHEAGYWYGDDTVLAFSAMHLHGTGAADYGVLGVMPVPTFDGKQTTDDGRRSTFAKSSETAEPGHYALTLDEGSIRVELGATPHVALYRFAFAKGAKEGHVVVDLAHHLPSCSVKDAEATLDAKAGTARGRLRSLGQMSKGFGGYDVFFALRAKAPWSSSKVWKDGAPPAEGTSVAGSGAGFVLDVDVTSGAPVDIAIGLSLVSADAAAANLEAEVKDLDFDAARAKTAAAWKERLGVVAVEGGESVERGMMAAMLYHAFLMPTRLSDVDGSYVGLDGAVHAAPADMTEGYFSDLSLWDTYRTLHPLYSLVAPDLAHGVARSLAAMAKDAGSLPRWPIATGESGVMLGASAEIVLADAWLKGVRGWGEQATWDLIAPAALDAKAPPKGRGGRDGIEGYMARGYDDAAHGDSSVSRTLEWSEDDFALAALARGLGRDVEADALAKRSLGWRALYDPKDGFLWPKNADGSFATPRPDPTTIGGPFDEANAWQSLWGAPHDLDGLVALMGSREAVVAKLDDFFVEGAIDHASLDPSQPLTAYAPRPYFWAGNEPSLHTPWLFARLGRPDLTARWVRWTMRSLFGPGADGLPGNDDGGTMSAWWVFAALGLYPEVGTDRYVVGAPLFPKATIAVKGGSFTIEARGVSTTALYVQSATLNGAPLTKAEITHADLHAGGSLVVEVGDTPSGWGKD